jgi:hypothetical protein
MTRDALFGTWSLLSMESVDAEGHVSHPMGRDASGYLMYGPDGYMSVILAGAHRPVFASQDLRQGTPDEKVAAFDTFLAYSGTYEVREHSVVHQVRESLFPNWAGGNQERLVAWEGRRLRLSTRPMPIDGVLRTVHLVFEPLDPVP